MGGWVPLIQLHPHPQDREEFFHEYEAQFISSSEAFFAVILAAIEMTRRRSKEIKESEFNQLR